MSYAKSRILGVMRLESDIRQHTGTLLVWLGDSSMVKLAIAGKMTREGRMKRTKDKLVKGYPLRSLFRLICKKHIVRVLNTGYPVDEVEYTGKAVCFHVSGFADCLTALERDLGTLAVCKYVTDVAAGPVACGRMEKPVERNDRAVYDSCRQGNGSFIVGNRKNLPVAPHGRIFRKPIAGSKRLPIKDTLPTPTDYDMSERLPVGECFPVYGDAARIVGIITVG